MLELNLSTILLQMANFFILVFILYRFLFAPVKNILKRRELEITREMEEAKIAQQEAEKTRKLFEEKTNNIDAEIAARTNEARIVIERTRQQMLQEVHTKVEQLKAQTEETLSQMQTRAIQQHKEKLGDLASEFAKEMLSGIMTPELQLAYREEFFNRIFGMDLKPFIKKIHAGEKPTARLILPSALEKSEKEHLEKAFKEQTQSEILIDYEFDPNLIAGGILRFENELIDGSLLGQILQFKKEYQEKA